MANNRILYIVFSLIFLSACADNPPISLPREESTVTDIEGNIYRTVKIGKQWWMAENLKVTRYADSTSIFNISKSQNNIWDTIKLGACCIYDDNVSAPGLLYNWYAVNDYRGLAPQGWHIPSDDEWKELEKYLGMIQSEIDMTNFRGINEGGKLKTEGVDNWAPYGNVWSGNESGFSALAGNCRMFNGTWGSPNDFRSTGFWWSSTLRSENNQAWYRHLDYKKENVFRYYGSKNYGFSIRCVKD